MIHVAARIDSNGIGSPLAGGPMLSNSPYGFLFSTASIALNVASGVFPCSARPWS